MIFDKCGKCFQYHLDRLLDGDLVGRGVHDFAVGQHPGGIAEPDGIPVGFNLAGRGPARTGAPIETLERRGIQEQRLQRHRLVQSYHLQ